MNTADIALALKDKVPNYRKLVAIPIQDNAEAMVKLETSDLLYINQIGEEMIPYTGNDVFVRAGIANRLITAATLLRDLVPDYLLQVHYGFRHPDIQQGRFNTFMKGLADRDDITDKEQYAHIFIAEPSVAGHPTGGAVDVAIRDRNTMELIDMGTKPRDFCDETLTFYPFISYDAWSNRNLLRDIMVQAGFAPYDGEWWHFSYGDREWACHYRQPVAFYGPVDLPAQV